MELAGNAAAGGKVSAAGVATQLTTLAPHLASPTLTATAQAVDEAATAAEANGGKLSGTVIASTLLHLATNQHLLTGTPATIANTVAGVLAFFNGQHAGLQLSL